MPRSSAAPVLCQVRHAAISPNGHFIAFSTNELGDKQDVVVRSFPDASRGRWKVSSNGGCCPRWKRDGSELYYVDPARHLVVVPVRVAPTFSMGPIRTLGLVVAANPAGPYLYDVSGDGQRFLVAMRPIDVDTNGRPIRVMLHWTAALKR